MLVDVPHACSALQRQHSDDDSDLLLRRGTVLYDFNPEEEDEVAVSKGETVEVEYEVGGWVQVCSRTLLLECWCCSLGFSTALPSVQCLSCCMLADIVYLVQHGAGGKRS